MRKFLWFGLAAVLILELLWVIGSAYYLNRDTFKQSLQAERVKTEFASAYSFFPGFLTVKGLRVSGEADRLRWSVSFEDSAAWINLFALLRRDFHVAWARLSQGRLVFKSIDGPIAPGEVQGEEGEVGPAGEPEPSAWSFHFHNLLFSHIEELTIGRLFLKGDSSLSGDFVISETGRMSARETAIAVDHAEARIDDAAFGKIRPSRIRLEFSDYDPERDEIKALIQKSKLDIDFRAALVDAKPLLAVFSKLSWLTIESSAVEAKARYVMEGSKIVAPTEIKLESKDFRLGIAKQLAKGSGHVLIKRRGDAKAETFSEIVLDAYGLRRQGQERDDIEGKGLRLSISSPDTDIFSSFKEWSAQLDLPTAQIRNFAFINAYIPKGIGAAIESGTGTFAGQIKAHSKQAEAGEGQLRFDAQKVQIRYLKSTLRADLKSDLMLSKIDLEKGLFALTSSTVQLGKVTTETLNADGVKETTEGWDGKLRLHHAAIKIEAPASYESQVDLEAKDMSPLLALYGAQKSLPQWVMESLNVKQPKLAFHIKANEQRMLLSDIAASGEKLNLKAWFDRQGEERSGRILLQYGKLKFGLGLAGDDFEVKLVGAESWYGNSSPSF